MRPALHPIHAIEGKAVMANDFPTQARIVIVGGGIIGCSVAYHLS
jgi:pyruvate/2-oxoglutarate dehydrogenase complex dihydrolipoamide dehydrogenase (E3) component